MAKTTSQRRFDKRAANLGALCTNQPEIFVRMWEQHVQGWLVEVRNRTRAQRVGDSDERHLRIFGVLELARRMAHSSDAMAQGCVKKGLAVIEHECAKAVANLMDSRLYQFNEDATTYIRNHSVRNRARG